MMCEPKGLGSPHRPRDHLLSPFVARSATAQSRHNLAWQSCSETGVAAHHLEPKVTGASRVHSTRLPSSPTNRRGQTTSTLHQGLGSHSPPCEPQGLGSCQCHLTGPEITFCHLLSHGRLLLSRATSLLCKAAVKPESQLTILSQKWQEQAEYTQRGSPVSLQTEGVRRLGTLHQGLGSHSPPCLVSPHLLYELLGPRANGPLLCVFDRKSF